MLKRVPPIFRHRTNRKRPRRATGPAGLSVTGVDSAEVFAGQLQFNVVFDTTFENPINDPSGADPTKWTARFEGTRYTGVLLAPVVEDRIFVLMDPAGAEVGGDVLNYSNAPSDISDSIGRFLPAFSGYPLS